MASIRPLFNTAGASKGADRLPLRCIYLFIYFARPLSRAHPRERRLGGEVRRLEQLNEARTHRGTST